METNTESGVAEAPAAGGQEGAPAAEVQQDVTVPLSVVKSLRNELSSAKEQSQNFQSQLEALRAQSYQQVPTGPTGQPFQQASPQQAPAPDAFKDPLEGLGDDDLVEAKHLRTVVESMRSSGRSEDAINKAIAPLATTLAKLELAQQDPKYEETIKTYLPEMLSPSNPNAGMLTEMIRRAPNPLMSALALAKMSPKYIAAQQASAKPNQQEAKPDVLSELSRIIENAAKPGNPGSMGGGSGAVSGNDRFRTMDDAAFDEEVARVLAQGPR